MDKQRRERLRDHVLRMPSDRMWIRRDDVIQLLDYIDELEKQRV